MQIPKQIFSNSASHLFFVYSLRHTPVGIISRPQAYDVSCPRFAGSYIPERVASPTQDLSVRPNIQSSGLDASCHSILILFLRHEEPICRACARLRVYMTPGSMMSVICRSRDPRKGAYR